MSSAINGSNDEAIDKAIRRSMLLNKSKDISDIMRIAKITLKWEYKSDLNMWEQAISRAFICKNLELFGDSVFNVINDLDSNDSILSLHYETLYRNLKLRLQGDESKIDALVDNLTKYYTHDRSSSTVSTLEKSVWDSSSEIINTFNRYLLSLKLQESLLPDNNVVKDLKNVIQEIKSILFLWKVPDYSGYFCGKENSGNSKCENSEYESDLSNKNISSSADLLMNNCDDTTDETSFIEEGRKIEHVSEVWKTICVDCGEQFEICNNDYMYSYNVHCSESKTHSTFLEKEVSVSALDNDAVSAERKVSNVSSEKELSPSDSNNSSNSECARVSKFVVERLGPHNVYISQKPNGDFYCTLCDVSLTNMNNAIDHVNTKDHFKKHECYRVAGSSVTDDKFANSNSVKFAQCMNDKSNESEIQKLMNNFSSLDHIKNKLIIENAKRVKDNISHINDSIGKSDFEVQWEAFLNSNTKQHQEPKNKLTAPAAASEASFKKYKNDNVILPIMKNDNNIPHTNDTIGVCDLKKELSISDKKQPKNKSTATAAASKASFMKAKNDNVILPTMKNDNNIPHTNDTEKESLISDKKQPKNKSTATATSEASSKKSNYNFIEVIGPIHSMYIMDYENQFNCRLCKKVLVDSNSIIYHVKGKTHNEKHEQLINSSIKDKKPKKVKIEPPLKSFENPKVPPQSNDGSKKAKPVVKLNMLDIVNEILATKYCNICRVPIPDLNEVSNHLKSSTHNGIFQMLSKTAKDKLRNTETKNAANAKTASSGKNPHKMGESSGNTEHMLKMSDVEKLIGKQSKFIQIKGQQLTCTLCKLETGAGEIKAHISSPNHTKKFVKFNEKKENLPNKKIPDQTSALSNAVYEHSVFFTFNEEKNSYFCWLCAVDISGIYNVVTHTNGNNHQKKYCERNK